jgi:hypothetical protein
MPANNYVPDALEYRTFFRILRGLVTNFGLISGIAGVVAVTASLSGFLDFVYRLLYKLTELGLKFFEPGVEKQTVDYWLAGIFAALILARYTIRNYWELRGRYSRSVDDAVAAQTAARRAQDGAGGATTAGAAVGMGIGAALGGPVGALLGALIGGVLGSTGEEDGDTLNRKAEMAAAQHRSDVYLLLRAFAVGLVRVTILALLLWALLWLNANYQPQIQETLGVYNSWIYSAIESVWSKIQDFVY